MIELEVISLKSNRSLCKIKISPSCTVLDIKKEVAKNRQKLNVNRQSVRLEISGKDQANNLTIEELYLQNGSKIYVKDLGPQVSWKMVFVLEYLGPLLIYLFMAQRPKIIYGEKYELLKPVTLTYSLALYCWTAHYAKRLLETLFVHRFSHATMPFSNLFKNCGYYWGFATYIAYHVNHPLYTEPRFQLTVSGLVLFVICELGNLSIHCLLRDLRPLGTSVRKIPFPNGNPFTKLFNLVSCPNYTYEFGAWIGFSIMTCCLSSFIFSLVGMYQMTIWAIGKHNAYRKEFSAYPSRRKAILPFIL